MKKHLDNEYKQQWEEFILDDGQVMDSRQINWRDVAWDRVIKILVKIKGNVHEFNSDQEGFVGFMNFRWGGQIAQPDKTIKRIHLWTVGWTDGIICYLTDIDFKTGQFVKNYTMTVKALINHVHPAILDRVKIR